MARTEAVFGDDGQAILLQGSSTTCWETAAMEEEGENQAMLFAMLQEKHNKQMASMAASNKANMDAMMEWMNVLAAASGGRRSNDKENTPPAGNTTPAGSGAGGKKKQETQVQEKPLSKLQNVCLPRPRQMLQVGGKQGHLLPQVDISVRGEMTLAGDRHFRSM
jgi:hypothetical protein